MPRGLYLSERHHTHVVLHICSLYGGNELSLATVGEMLKDLSLLHTDIVLLLTLPRRHMASETFGIHIISPQRRIARPMMCATRF